MEKQQRIVGRRTRSIQNNRWKEKAGASRKKEERREKEESKKRARREQDKSRWFWGFGKVIIIFKQQNGTGQPRQAKEMASEMVIHKVL